MSALGDYVQRLTPAQRGRRVVLAVFVVTRLAIWLAAPAFTTNYIGTAFQLLDPRMLGAHPFRSVFYLHTQPPLFNLFVGGVMRWTPFDVPLTFHGLYVLCGLVLALALYQVLLELGAPAWMAAVAASVAIASPYVSSQEQVVAYELPVATMLVLATWGCIRYVKKRTLAPFAAFVTCVTAIVLTRSLFHWIWLVAVVGGVLVFVRPKASWRKVGLVCAIAAALVGGVIVKNAVLFDSPSLSSWSGMNLERSAIWPLPRADLIQLQRQGVLSPQAIVPTLSPYWKYEWLYGPCKPDHRDPVVGSALDSTGRSNLNASCYLPIYRQAQRDAVATIRHRPLRFVESRRIAGALYVSNIRADGASGSIVTRALGDLYQPFYAPVAMHFHIGKWPFTPVTGDLKVTISLSVLAWLLVVAARGVAAMWRLIRRRRRPLDVAWAFIGVTFVFATFMSLIGEFAENARFRAYIDPLLVAIIAWDLCRAGAWVVAKARVHRAGPAPPAPAEVDADESVTAVRGSGALSRPAGVR